MAQKKEQWFIIIAASLFLAGAVLVLINALGGIEWALWVGIGFAVASIILYIVVYIARVQFNKKYTPSESEIIAAEQKAVTAPADEAVVAEPVSSPAPAPLPKSKPKTSTKKSTNKSKSKNNKKRK